VSLITEQHPQPIVLYFVNKRKEVVDVCLTGTSANCAEGTGCDFKSDTVYWPHSTLAVAGVTCLSVAEMNDHPLG
jgi:hypothetical protein